MNRIIKNITALFFRLFGVHLFFRAFYSKDKVAVLVYHDPDPETFRGHMRYLAGRYNFISLQDLVDALRAGQWSRIPEHSIVVTLDDGFERNVLLLEIFREFGIRPTVYLCTSVVGTRRRYWHSASGDRREQAWLKSLHCREALGYLREKYGYEPDKQFPERIFLSKEEVERMANEVDFQSHTRNHFMLTKCSDEECRNEIEGSKRDMEEMLKEPCRHFAFPYGDHSDREVRYVEEAGYESARTAIWGLVSKDSDPYALGCVHVPDDSSVTYLMAQLSGLGKLVQTFSRIFPPGIRSHNA